MDAKNIAESCTAGLEHFQRQLDELRLTSSTSAPSLETLASEFGDFRSKIQSMLGSLLARTTDLEYRIQELEAKGRRNTLLVHGVKEDNAVAPSTAALGIIQGRLGCSSVTLASLDKCYRLGQADAGRSTPRPIVVRFAHRDDRYAVWSKKKALKGTRILVTESLIRPRQQLFMEARTVFKANNSWTRDGKIIVMFPDGSKEVLWRNDQLEAAKSRLSSIQSTDKCERRTALRSRQKK